MEGEDNNDSDERPFPRLCLMWFAIFRRPLAGRVADGTVRTLLPVRDVDEGGARRTRFLGLLSQLQDVAPEPGASRYGRIAAVLANM